MLKDEKGTPFRRFWVGNRVNLLVALAITLVICLIVGLQGVFMPLPLWLALGVVCWLVRLWLVYRSWLRSGGDRQDRDHDQDGT